MRAWRVTSLGILLVVPLVADLSGQSTTPPAPTQSSKWWNSPTIKAELGLTDQQSMAVEAIFQATLPKLRTSKDELDRLEATLSKLLDAGADEAQVLQHIDRVEAARSDMSKTRTLMLLRMRRVLSQEQRTKLTAVHERSSRARDHDDRN
jgi:Spy/CpxP family protein refolding chaperone